MGPLSYIFFRNSEEYTKSQPRKIRAYIFKPHFSVSQMLIKHTQKHLEFSRSAFIY